MKDHKINIQDMDVLFRDLDKSLEILEEEYFLKFKKPSNTCTEELILKIDSITKEQIKDLGIMSETDFDIFSIEDKNNLDKSYIKHALIQI